MQTKSDDAMKEIKNTLKEVKNNFHFATESPPVGRV